MSKTIKVGVDFDGVLAYNPFRVARAIVAFVKGRVLGVRTLRFFVPKNSWQRFIWAILHESSVFPAIGGAFLKSLARNKRYEFYLVTSRFGFLEPQLTAWLRRWKFTSVFRSIEINHDHEQPHEFKARIAKKLDLDYFIEDNWDIVEHLNKTTRVKVLWIYNILDRGRAYRNKFPYLEKALLKIQQET